MGKDGRKRQQGNKTSLKSKKKISLERNFGLIALKFVLRWLHTAHMKEGPAIPLLQRDH